MLGYSSWFKSRNSSIYYIHFSNPSILDVIKFFIKKSSASWISRSGQRRIDWLFSYCKSYVNWRVIAGLYEFRFFRFRFIAFNFRMEFYENFSEGIFGGWILREFFGGDIMEISDFSLTIFRFRYIWLRYIWYIWLRFGCKNKRKFYNIIYFKTTFILYEIFNMSKILKTTLNIINRMI